MKTPNIELWLFLVLILGWVAFVSVGITLGALVHLLPLVAVLILANRLRRSPRQPEAPGDCEPGDAKAHPGGQNRFAI